MFRVVKVISQAKLFTATRNASQVVCVHKYHRAIDIVGWSPSSVYKKNCICDETPTELHMIKLKITSPGYSAKRKNFYEFPLTKQLVEKFDDYD